MRDQRTWQWNIGYGSNQSQRTISGVPRGWKKHDWLRRLYPRIPISIKRNKTILFKSRRIDVSLRFRSTICQILSSGLSHTCSTWGHVHTKSFLQCLLRQQPRIKTPPNSRQSATLALCCGRNVFSIMSPHRSPFPILKTTTPKHTTSAPHARGGTKRTYI